MRRLRSSFGLWVAVAAALAGVVVGGLWLVRSDIAARREAFRVEARSLHRLLSQRMAQHEAILATLALGHSGAPGFGVQRVAIARVPSGLPQIQSAWVIAGEPVPDDVAVAGRPPPVDLSNAPPGVEVFFTRLAESAQPGDVGRYWLMLRRGAVAHALEIDAAQMRDDPQWPVSLATEIRAHLLLAPDRPVVLQPGTTPESQPWGWTAGFQFDEPLASLSQSWRLRVALATGPAEWPWAALGAWGLIWCTLVGLFWRVGRDRVERARTAQLMRLARVGRLNAMGELAAGMAHELNQPLTAALAGTQAALRLLREEDATNGGRTDADLQEVPRVDPAVIAPLELAVAQTRRAAAVVARLRRLVQAPQIDSVGEAVDMAALLHDLADWMKSDLTRHAIRLRIEGAVPRVRADRVALEQVLHNLLTNAAQALQKTTEGTREIHVQLSCDGRHVRCAVADTGPGLSEQAREHMFEPFFTTREGGLGLGLSLSQSLMQSMGGELEVGTDSKSGACFVLSLPCTPVPDSTSTP